MPATMEILYRQFEALRHAGQDACLRLECHAGQVWLNLQVHIQQPPRQHQNLSPSSKNSPSRQRRRARRKAAREAATDAVEASKVVVAKVAVPPKAVHLGDAEQAGPGHRPQAHQQKLPEGQVHRERPTAASIASLSPFKISQLDGQHSDTDDMPDNVNMITDKLAKLSSTNVCSTDIPPDPYPCRFCLLVSELPNYPSPKPTDPVCTVCRRPIDDRFNPHSCCDLLMHENCWGQHRCIGWE